MVLFFRHDMDIIIYRTTTRTHSFQFKKHTDLLNDRVTRKNPGFEFWKCHGEMGLRASCTRLFLISTSQTPKIWFRVPNLSLHWTLSKLYTTRNRFSLKLLLLNSDIAIINFKNSFKINSCLFYFLKNQTYCHRMISTWWIPT